MRQAMSFTKDQLETVSEYVKNKFHLVENQMSTDNRFNLLQQELKHQRELMIEGFKNFNKRFEEIQHNMDKRFENAQLNMDKRFEQVDKRFESVQQNMDIRFAESREDFKSMFNFMKWQTGLGFVMVAGIYLKMFIG